MADPITQPVGQAQPPSQRDTTSGPHHLLRLQGWGNMYTNFCHYVHYCYDIPGTIGTLFSLHLSQLLLFCPATKEKGDEMVSCDSSTTH